MDSQLNLLGGFRRDVAVQRMTEHLETTYWPSVLSETVEELLIDQIAQTAYEVASLLIDQGYGLEQIAVEVERLRDSVEERHRPEYVDGGPITLLRQLVR